MRPLHEVLPLVRTILWDGTKPYDWLKDQRYTCNAANDAWGNDLITSEECDDIIGAIMTELHAQYAAAGGRLRIACLVELFHKTIDSTLHSNQQRYVPMRDAWLDALQRKLEALHEPS